MVDLDNLLWIIDRTAEDIKYISNPLLDVGKIEAHKGAFNYQDMNRISVNLKIIADTLEELGYFVRADNLRNNWRVTDIPYFEDIEEIRGASNIYRNIFKMGIPIVLTRDTIDYIDLNRIEEILSEVNQYFKNIKKQQIYTGDAICGGEY